MKCLLQAATALGVIEMVSATDMVGRVIDEAADKTEATAELLEEIEKHVKEDEDDLSVQ